MLYAVQGELMRRGFFRGVINGRPGPATSDAIVRLQQDEGLPVSGRLDNETLNDLRAFPGQRNGPPEEGFRRAAWWRAVLPRFSRSRFEWGALAILRSISQNAKVENLSIQACSFRSGGFRFAAGMEAIIESLGECHFLSPLRHRHAGIDGFRTEEHRVIYDDSMEGVRDMFERGLSPLNFEMAGPREKIYFDPGKTSAAIVTCGGLCPGLNDIIRGVVMELYHRYGVTRIFGLRYGYEGLIPRQGHVPLGAPTRIRFDDSHLWRNHPWEFPRSTGSR